MQGIKYVSPGDSTGYGTAARRLLQALAARAIPVTWTPMVLGPGWGLGYEPLAGGSVGDPVLDRLVQRPIPYDTVVLHTVPEYYPRWIEREPGKRVVGATVWETDRLPAHWPALLNRLDGLIVPCGWNRDVFQASGVTTPIQVVPHLRDPALLPDSRPEALPVRIPARVFVFYTIGTWTHRKGVDDTIRAYLRAFTARDPVVLVVKTSRHDLSRVRFRRLLGRTSRLVRRLLREHPTPARVVLITRELDEDGIRALHGRGDCFVSLCRSEGWGLGAYDAASSGHPVVMTGYGGQCDFLPPEHAYRIDHDLEPVHEPLYRDSYDASQQWARPDVGHASRLLREVFDHRDEARRRGRALKEYLHAHFDTDALVHAFLDAAGADSASIECRRMYKAGS